MSSLKRQPETLARNCRPKPQLEESVCKSRDKVRHFLLNWNLNQNCTAFPFGIFPFLQPRHHATRAAKTGMNGTGGWYTLTCVP